MSNEWSWLIGRRFMGGKVIEVLEDEGTVTIQVADLQIVVPISALLREYCESQDRADRAMSEALNTGNGTYKP